MSLVLHPDPLPLRVDKYGAIRVGSSNVLLDLVIEEFEAGNSPEAIVHGYDTLNLADVYATIAYYLRHREDVKAYLAQREKEAEELKRKIEASQPQRPNFKEELLARRARMEAANDAAARNG
jgi:uncharacterized protein (DUF433 family)